MADDHWEIKLFFVTLIALFSVGAIGQQVGVSLQLNGKTIPNNSLVDLEELLYNPQQDPTNANGLQTLMCVTDLTECCETPALGNWYYPDGSTIDQLDDGGIGPKFRSNRGQNEVINGQPFYGSVRLWRRWTPRERGLFRCELPDTNDVNQSLYVNILIFYPFNGTRGEFSVIISANGSSTAGETYSLICSATLYPDRNPPLPDPSIPSPTFEWFYDSDGNASSLPLGLNPETTFNGSTYISELEFSPLHQFHAGNYTCRLGAGNLANSIIFTVTVPSILAVLIANLNAPLEVGQTGNTLTCEVSGAERLSPIIAYQWTRNNQVVSDGNLKTLNLSPLRLSHAGSYACNITVSSALLSSSISASSHENEDVIVQIPEPQSVTITSSDVFEGADVTINCTLDFGQPVMEIELSLLMMDVQLSSQETYTMRNLSDSNPVISGTILTYSTVVNSFSRSDSGNYSCVVTITPHPNLIQLSSFYLNRTEKSMYNQTQVTTGVFFSSRSSIINTNSNIFITDIGEGDCGALLCYTDLNECCHDSNTSNGALGQWFYPNGSDVGLWNSGQDFYVDRGPGVVRLNRRTNATSVTGLFCCVVPDATSTETRICITVIAPQSKQMVTCSSKTVAIGAIIGVVVTVIVECLIIGAPIIVVLFYKHKLCLKIRMFLFNEKDNCKLSNKAATNVPGGRRVKESDHNFHNKASTDKPDDEDYEVMNSYTMPEGDDNPYAVPDNDIIAAKMRGRGRLEMREDTYDDYVICDTVSTATTSAAMQPSNGERESTRSLQLYEDPDNPGPDATTSLEGKFGH